MRARGRPATVRHDGVVPHLESFDDGEAQRQAELEELLAGVAHDVCSVAAGINLAASLLEREAAGRPLPAMYLPKIQSSARWLAELSRELVECSSLKSRRALHLEPRALARDVEQVLGTLAAQADEAKVGLESRIDPGVTALADGAKLHRILGNLVGNALKFTPPGGRVEVGCDDAPREVRVEVSDTGVGISDEALPHVFRPYWHGRSRASGTGLGLAIARTLVAAHGGEIGAERRRGGGTTVWFTVPRATRSVPRASARGRMAESAAR